MSAAQQRKDLERHMRRHWERLDTMRSADSGKRKQRDGRAMSSWQPGELIPARASTGSTQRLIREKRLLKESNERLVTRLFNILDPQEGDNSKRESKRGFAAQMRKEEVEYLRIKGIRARMLSEDRAIRGQRLADSNNTLLKQRQAVTSRVPEHKALIKEYQNRRKKQEHLRKFRVSPTAMHLIPKSPDNRTTLRPSASKKNISAGFAMLDCEDHCLPQWYKEAQEEARKDTNTKKSHFPNSLTSHLRRPPPSTSSFTATRPSSAHMSVSRSTPVFDATKRPALSSSNNRRPRSAHAGAVRPKTKQYNSDIHDGYDAYDDSLVNDKCGEDLDWIMYTEEEVRQGLLGTSPAVDKRSSKKKTTCSGDSPSDTPPSKKPEQEGGGFPIEHQKSSSESPRELIDSEKDQLSYLEKLIASHNTQCLDILGNQEFICPKGGKIFSRVRCSLLSELPTKRMQLPKLSSNRRHSSSPPSSPSRTAVNSRKSAEFSVLLYDLGLICPSHLLQSKCCSSPTKGHRADQDHSGHINRSNSYSMRSQEDGETSIAVTTGVLIECRNQGDNNSTATNLIKPLYLPISQLLYACENSPRENTRSISLCRKLLRLRCPCRARKLYENLNDGLSAEGLEQLCSFIADSVEIKILNDLEQGDASFSPSKDDNPSKFQMAVNIPCVK